MKNKIKNSPRLENAIKRVISVIHDKYGKWWHYGAEQFGINILYIAYGADKYDVLSSLYPNVHRRIITYARGDIRHKQSCYLKFLLLLLMMLAIYVFTRVIPC